MLTLGCGTHKLWFAALIYNFKMQHRYRYHHVAFFVFGKFVVTTVTSPVSSSDQRCAVCSWFDWGWICWDNVPVCNSFVVVVTGWKFYWGIIYRWNKLMRRSDKSRYFITAMKKSNIYRKAVFDLQHLQWQLINFYWLAVYIVCSSNIICELYGYVYIHVYLKVVYLPLVCKYIFYAFTWQLWMCV